MRVPSTRVVLERSGGVAVFGVFRVFRVPSCCVTTMRVGPDSTAISPISPMDSNSTTPPTTLATFVL